MDAANRVQRVVERDAATGRFVHEVLPATECGFCDVCEGPTEHGECVVDREHTAAVAS